MNKAIAGLALMCAMAWGQGIQKELFLDAKLPKFGARTLDPDQMVMSKRWIDSGFVIVMSFGATWCAPCRLELPFLDSIAKTNPKIRILSVLTDPTQDKKVMDFAQKMKLSFPMMLDQGEILAKRFGVGQELPYLVITDKQGIVRKIRTGFDPSEKKEIAALIASLSAN